MFWFLLVSSFLALAAYVVLGRGPSIPAETAPLSMTTSLPSAFAGQPGSQLTAQPNSSHGTDSPLSASATLSDHGAPQAGDGPQQSAISHGVARRVGIIAGHKNNDSGTVCSDGLTEAQVNLSVATRVVSLMRAQGYQVDDPYDEFDPRLVAYRAALLLSIHADSCEYINDQATGFKVAARASSQTPDADKALVSCLIQKYAADTGLPFHANSITYDMTNYHNFSEIDPKTPAAIIETGFLYLDRNLLVDHQDKVAQGIADGLLCYLKGE